MHFIQYALLVLGLLATGVHAADPAIPDTTTNRHATAADAAHWHNVTEGDYLFFSGNFDNGGKIIVSNRNPVVLPAGAKILFYPNEYEQVILDGSHCENSPTQPTVITNFGGQVKIGNSEKNDAERGLVIANFKHVHLTGRFDPDAGTGHPDYRGHDAGRALDSGDYYEKYGIWIDFRWSGPRFHNTYGNMVRAYGYESLKIDYVASWGGGFAAFNLKTDNPANPGVVHVDIQDTFSGFTESEGFYVSYNTGGKNQDYTRLLMRNNIIAFPGGDGLQTDNLAPGSLIEHNVIIGSGQFYRAPFQANWHDNAHQSSYGSGDVIIRNNLYFGAVGYFMAPRFKDPEDGRFSHDPSHPVLIKSNYFGYGEDNIGWINEGHPQIPLQYVDNVFGPISVPSMDDSWGNKEERDHFLTLANSLSPITLKNNIVPSGAQFFSFTKGTGTNLIENVDNRQEAAPPVEFINLGFSDDFDPRVVGFYQLTYKNAPDGIKEGQAATYESGDVVIIYNEDGDTLFFECTSAHTANSRNQPLRDQVGVWRQLTWDGRSLPPLDVRLRPSSFYDSREIGLTYEFPDSQGAHYSDLPFQIYLCQDPELSTDFGYQWRVRQATQEHLLILEVVTRSPTHADMLQTSTNLYSWSPLPLDAAPAPNDHLQNCFFYGAEQLPDEPMFLRILTATQ